MSHPPVNPPSQPEGSQPANQPWPVDQYGQPWPADPYGRPWPVDQFGRWWPADAYGRPVSPYYGAPLGAPTPTPVGSYPVGSSTGHLLAMAAMPGPAWAPAAPRELQLYRGAPATLVAAVARQAEGGQTVKRSTWGLWDVLIVFGLWFLLAVAGSFLVLATDQSGSVARGIGMIVATVLPWAALIGWPVLMTKVRGNGPVVDLGLRWKWSDIGWGLLWGLAGLVVAIVLAMLTTALFGDFSSAAGDVAESLADNKVIFAIFLLTVVFGAPFAEEFFFRGYVFAAFGKKGWLPILSVLMSAAIFAAWHLEPVRLLLLFGIGVTLGLARWLTSSLTTSIVAHMTNNLVSSITLIGLLFS